MLLSASLFWLISYTSISTECRMSLIFQMMLAKLACKLGILSCQHSDLPCCSAVNDSEVAIFVLKFKSVPKWVSYKPCYLWRFWSRLPIWSQVANPFAATFCNCYCTVLQLLLYLNPFAFKANWEFLISFPITCELLLIHYYSLFWCYSIPLNSTRRCYKQDISKYSSLLTPAVMLLRFVARIHTLKNRNL